MAGLQSCFRSITISSNFRLLQKFQNGVFRNASRQRHSLAFHIISRERPYRSKLLVNSFLRCNVRLASTDIPKQEEEVLKGTPQSTENVTLTLDIKDSTFTIDEASLPPIPTIEDPSQAAAVLEFVSTGLKEPSFESLGLNSFWPHGLFQMILEFLHVKLHLPWWGAIIIFTITFRLLLLPLNIKARRNAVLTSNHLPELHRLQTKLTETRISGNYYDSALHLQELMDYTQKHNISPLKSFLPQLAQSPVFISMYIALKQMAEAPVESLKTGGIFWFQDLTVPDPYYILPCVVAGSVFLILETGAEGGSLSQLNNFWLKNGLRGLCLAFIPISIYAPQGVLWYWTVSNAITFIQVSLLKLKPVKKYFNIPEYVKHDPSVALPKKKSFTEGFRESVTNFKLTKELHERDHLNSVTFENAGKAPLQRTFKKNPKLRANSSK